MRKLELSPGRKMGARQKSLRTFELYNCTTDNAHFIWSHNFLNTFVT